MAIARIALPVPASAAFDYWIPDGLAIGRGALVRVRLAGRALRGIVIDVVATSDVAREKLQPVREVMHDVPALSDDLLHMAEFVATYYQEPLGLVLAQMVPPHVAGSKGSSVLRRRATPLRLTALGHSVLATSLARAPRVRALFEEWVAAPDFILATTVQAALPPYLKHAVRNWQAAGWVEAASREGDRTGDSDDHRVTHAPLNIDQRQAVTAIVDAGGTYAPFLLQGVTGSGKTEVYLAAAGEFIAAGGQVLILVPEINLTPQFLQRIAGVLPTRRTVTLHSGLSGGERMHNWRAAAAGDADVVLGTRLAVFAPLPRLAFIVVDEEHDPSFKQQDGVRYHGRDVAVWRARQRAVPVVLGSATPALETLVHAQCARYRWLKLPFRAVAPARLPSFAFVPNRDAHAFEGLGVPLMVAIKTRLELGLKKISEALKGMRDEF